MNTSKNFKFMASHEWARLEDDGSFTVGISNYAQDLLGDIVFVELPEVGKNLNQSEEAAIVESVKAASEIYSPLSGEVVSINTSLEANPETINSSPYEGGWFFKLKPNKTSEFENLLSPSDYEKICKD